MPATTRTAYRFVGAWLGACVIGGLLDAVLHWSALANLYQAIASSPTSSSGLNGGLLFERFLDAALFAGFVVGLPGFVLGRRLRHVELPWLGATVVFAVLASIASFAIEDQLAFVASVAVPSVAASWSPAVPLFSFPFVVGGFSGLFIGVGQAIVLARYLRFTAWWVAPSCFAFALSAGSVTITNWLISGAGTRIAGPNDYFAEMIVGAITAPVIIGLVTGIALVRLLRNQRVQFSTGVGGPARA